MQDRTVLILLICMLTKIWWSLQILSRPISGTSHEHPQGMLSGLEAPAKLRLATNSPVLLEFEPCAGFAEQEMQAVKALMVGSELGAQVVFISNNGHVWDLWEMENSKLFQFADSFFRDNACHGPPGVQRKFWCGQVQMPAISILDQNDFDLARSLRKRLRIEHAEQFESLRYNLWLYQPSIAHLSCGVLSNFPIVEPGVEWELFWKIWDKVEFKQDIQKTKQKIEEQIMLYGAGAREKTRQMGFTSFPNDTAFNVLHLRMEPDWRIFCELTFSASGPPNCMNNTFEVGNVLLSEGITPSIPLYLATTVSTKRTLEQWRGQSSAPFAGDNLFNIYTIITHEMLAETIFNEWTPRLGHHKMFWPAVSSLLGMNANMFVGNSVSTFSGFLMQQRLRIQKRSIHYNGGTLRLQETKQLAPKKKWRTELFRKKIKWLFCIQPREGQTQDSSAHMAKVAIKSAFAKTSLVPIGVTTASPTSKFAAELVAAGVRLIYHTPSWVPHIKAMISQWEGSKNRFSGDKKPSPLLSDVDAVVGTFLRIDIPILGLLDPFLFYADIDILFQNDVTWPKLLGATDKQFKKIKDLPYEQQVFAKPGQEGIPMFFAMSAESEMEKVAANAGVMLWNVQSMRESYPSFLNFIVKSGDITWPIGPGDQGALRTFYQGDRGPSYLPYLFNWKAYWPWNPTAVLVHFHGPKCEGDILPYLDDGRIRLPLFQFLLKRCQEGGNCLELCRQYMNYLQD